MALPDDIERVRALVAGGGLPARLFERLEARAASWLAAPPVQRVLGGRDPSYMVMLGQSREALDRIYGLAFLYRYTADRRWADRAIAELDAVCAFSDWNPSHWLDTAEMMHAVAIGYDWLFDILNDSQRERYASAIVEKGLHAAERAYAEGAWWTTNAYNWNIVCAMGTIIGVLAVADREPALAEKLIGLAREHMPIALKSYAPDGGWIEGVMYWSYASRYFTVGCAALESALGTDLGLSASPGLDGAGRYRLHGVGPTGRYFNFADASETSPPESALFWFARRFNDPVVAWGARRSWSISKGDPAFAGEIRSLLWYDSRGDDADVEKVALDGCYIGPGAAFMRSSWTDPDAVFVGFKGGDAQAAHGHLDIGTFVLDALGERWICDLGPDDYTLPGYWDERRWSYYRLGTHGHNVPLLNSANHALSGVAPITLKESTPDTAAAVADLTTVWREQGARMVRRTVALINGRRNVRVQDEFELERPAVAEAHFHTRAKVTLADNRRAILELNGRTLHARLDAPDGVTWCAAPVHVNPPETPIEGVTRLSIRAPEGTAVKWAIEFSSTPLPARDRHNLS